MPRLAVEEDAQHGSRTGSSSRKPVVSRATPKKRSEPRAVATSAKKQRQFPSPRSAACLATEYVGLPKKQKPRREALNRLTEKFNVNIQYPKKLVSAIRKGKKLPTRKGAGGRPHRITPEDEELIRSTLEDHAYALTFRQLEEKTTIPASTTCRFMKNAHGTTGW